MTVAVRFAPSPTGYLHVGNVSSAIKNYLFAKQHHGKFYLRIDDTDIKRSEKKYEEAIIEDLNWLGIKFDGLFHQSKRFDLYNKVKQVLIKRGVLYPCYESAEELDLKRKLQRSQGKPPIYDRHALQLTEQEKKSLEERGIKSCWRFLLPDGSIEWEDLTHGPIAFKSRSMSDPVLVREDGTFLYTLPSVIDDIDMGITHVIRGEDHISNTAVQIPLYKVVAEILGKPFNLQFAHVNLLSGPNGEPLSKRLGSLAIRDFRAQGIEPETIISYLTFLGSRHPISCKYSWEDLIPYFDIKDYKGAAPKFSSEDIVHLNEKYYQDCACDKVETGLTSEIWALVKYNIHTKADIKVWENIFSDRFKNQIEVDPEYQRLAMDMFPQGPIDEESWKIWTTTLKEKTGRKGKDLYQPLRLMLTGLTNGPEMKYMLPLLGADLVKMRLKT